MKRLQIRDVARIVSAVWRSFVSEWEAEVSCELDNDDVVRFEIFSQAHQFFDNLSISFGIQPYPLKSVKA
eukprot:Skav204345  [mRNA]  locus=scaffold3936:68120:68329:- [translate_table: standard]